MAVLTRININIEGQVNGESNEEDIVVAKLNVICAEYGLKLTEKNNEDN